MSTKTRWMIAGLAACTMTLAACGGGSHDVAVMPPPTQIKGETVAGVLAMASAPSETSDALDVGNDALASNVLDDETSDPVPVG